MKNRNLSIPDIARATGLSDSTLRSIISRKTKNISLEVAFKLSQGLNVSLEELNGDKEITSNPLEKYSKEEQQHIEDLRKLNDIGKNKVITYTKDLMDNPKFINEPIQNQNEDEISSTSLDDFEPYLLAAHSDGLDEETNKANIEKIKKMYLEIKGK
ncbi:TPA: helix-turn-helix transcriptional regulator [Clostridium perfringens]|nr:helix-turn-helix transcriptional regulator [Clostridium perfringens]